jgi:hypothetical protein
MIGKTIDVVVTSVLQTTAGKMIFGRFIDPATAAQAAPSTSASAAAAPEGEPVRRARSQVPSSAATAGK